MTQILEIIMGLILISSYAMLWIIIGLKLQEKLNDDVLGGGLALGGFFLFIPLYENAYDFFKALFF